MGVGGLQPSQTELVKKCCRRREAQNNWSDFSLSLQEAHGPPRSLFLAYTGLYISSELTHIHNFSDSVSKAAPLISLLMVCGTQPLKHAAVLISRDVSFSSFPSTFICPAKTFDTLCIYHKHRIKKLIYMFLGCYSLVVVTTVGYHRVWMFFPCLCGISADTLASFHRPKHAL